MTETTRIMLPKVRVAYKARLFEMLYEQKPELLELYNAVHHTNYKDPELLEINTLENAIYISMYNDISFIIDSRLALYEHQSTENPNLPLRYLMYVSDLYSELTKDQNLYGTRRIPIPTPEFITFYNGEKELPDMQTLKLSEAFTVEAGEPSLELKVTVLNINPGHNEELKSACKSLRDYSIYTSKVRKYAKNLPLEEAVERAITECIENDILAEFLEKNRAEAVKVSIYEYDEAKYTRMVKEEGRSEGEALMAALTKRLLDAGRVDDLREATENPEKRKQLFEEFEIQ